MFKEPAVFVDIETNGKMGPEGRIIEIGLLRVENDCVVKEYQSLVNPGGRIPYWIEKLTGIKNADLTNAPYFDEIVDELEPLLDGAIFVAHNVRFDYSFFKSHLKAVGKSYNPKLFCTVRMSRALYPEHRRHNLESIISRHAIQTTHRHRAFDDAKAMYDFTVLAYNEKGKEAFDQNVALQIKTKTLPPHVDEAIVASLPTEPGVYIFNDEQGQPLYVGKSINIRDRVRSHFMNDTRIVKEMKLSQRSYSIDTITTDTEVEALLLESAKVKELKPLLNRQLRASIQQSILVKDYNAQGYLTIRIENKDLSEATDLSTVYGVYTSRMKAKNALERMTKTFQLCPKLMSLEKVSSACFRYQLGQCKGACEGHETVEAYNRRAEIALSHSKVESWPFASKIAIKISQTKSLIVDQWIIEGILNYEYEPILETISNGFDIDTYKILRAFVKGHKESVSMIDLSSLSFMTT